MKRLEKWLLIVAFVAAIGIFLFAFGKVIEICKEYEKGDKTYEKLEKYVETKEKTEQEPEGLETAGESSEEKQIDFEGLKAVNPDVIAWIELPALDISYPVVQGEDNQYYLSHLFTGEENSNGSIFADYHNQPDFSDQNTILYGHNMRSGSMFGTLERYQERKFWESAPCFYIYVPGTVYEYRIFSCYAGRTGGSAYIYRFQEKEAFGAFLQDICRYADYQTGIEVSENDRIVTLSTCVNSARDYRYIVHGKLNKSESNRK